MPLPFLILAMLAASGYFVNRGLDYRKRYAAFIGEQRRDRIATSMSEAVTSIIPATAAGGIAQQGAASFQTLPVTHANTISERERIGMSGATSRFTV